MKKIAFTTIFNVPNFGSVLQAYATQKILENMGFEVFLINYQFPNEWHYRHGLHKISIKSKIIQFLGLCSWHRKAKKINVFRHKFLHLTKLYKSLDDLKKESWDVYDMFCVGSDQVWNPRFVLGDSAFMLSYIPGNRFKFSLASSFAAKTLPEKERNKYRLYLSQFNALSVREENGIRVIREELHIEKNIKKLLDPTLLLTQQEWCSLITKPFKNTNKYLLVYMLYYAFEPRPYIFDVIKYFQQKCGYEVIVLEGYQGFKNCQLHNIKNATDSSVSDFINLFLNADLVITSSFHGTAFSVNFNIPLISIVPDGEGDDRQSTLLKSLGLEQCIIKIGSPITDINPFYDKVQLKKKLSDKRGESLSWLHQVLSSNKYSL